MPACWRAARYVPPSQRRAPGWRALRWRSSRSPLSLCWCRRTRRWVGSDWCPSQNSFGGCCCRYCGIAGACPADGLAGAVGRLRATEGAVPAQRREPRGGHPPAADPTPRGGQPLGRPQRARDGLAIVRAIKKTSKHMITKV
eukprot:7999021-Pyramimonas_sp.AAC.1